MYEPQQRSHNSLEEKKENFFEKHLPTRQVLPGEQQSFEEGEISDCEGIELAKGDEKAKLDLFEIVKSCFLAWAWRYIHIHVTSEDVMQELYMVFKQKNKKTMKQLNKQSQIFIQHQTPILKSLLNDLTRIKIVQISKDQEKLLFQKIQKGCKESRNFIITNNLHQCFNIAKQYSTGDGLLDIYNECVYGLMQAIPKFDLKKNVRFISFANIYIHKYVIEFLTANHLVKIPIDQLLKINKIKKEEQTDYLIEKRVSEENARGALLSAFQVVNAKFVEQDFCQEQNQEQNEFQHILFQLPVKEKKIIEMFFGLDQEPKNVREISLAMNKNIYYILKLKKSALARMKYLIENYPHLIS